MFQENEFYSEVNFCACKAYLYAKLLRDLVKCHNEQLATLELSLFRIYE